MKKRYIVIAVILLAGCGVDTDPTEPDPTWTVEESPLPQESPSPSPSSVATSPTTDAPSISGEEAEDVYYSNCTEVKRAGKAPLRRNDPGYRKALDRDGDGVACDR